MLTNDTEHPEDTVRRRTQKVMGIPAGKSWGIGDAGHRVTVIRKADGRVRVVCGWIVQETMDSDATDYTTPIPQFAGRPHVGWACTLPSLARAAEVLCDIAARAGRDMPDDATEIEQFSTI